MVIHPRLGGDSNDLAKDCCLSDRQRSTGRVERQLFGSCVGGDADQAFNFDLLVIENPVDGSISHHNLARKRLHRLEVREEHLAAQVPQQRRALQAVHHGALHLRQVQHHAGIS